jgi:hypothetical protein
MNDKREGGNAPGPEDWTNSIEAAVWGRFKRGIEQHPMENPNALRTRLRERVRDAIIANEVTREDWDRNRWWVLLRVKEVGLVSIMYANDGPITVEAFNQAFDEVKSKCHELVPVLRYEPLGRFCN